MEAIYTMKGAGVVLEVFEDKVTLTPKGVMSFLGRGIKEIPFASITAVRFRKCGFVTTGFLQFTILGSNKSRGGMFADGKDENTFMWWPGTWGWGWSRKERNERNARVAEIKEYIDSAVRELRTPQATKPKVNLSDELQKLAELKEQGALSEEEFKAAKEKLIR